MRCSPGVGLIGVVGGCSTADDDTGCPSPDAAGSWLTDVIAVEGCPCTTADDDDADSPSPGVAGSWLPDVTTVEGCPFDNTDEDLSADDASIGWTTDDAETSKQQNMAHNSGHLRQL